MVDWSNVGDEYSQAWRTSLNKIDELGLLDDRPNQMEADPIAEEPEELDMAEGELEVESDDIYVGRVFPQ